MDYEALRQDCIGCLKKIIESEESKSIDKIDAILLLWEMGVITETENI